MQQVKGLVHADTCGPAAVGESHPAVVQRPDAIEAIATAEQALKATPVADLLRRAKAVIADPGKWIKGIMHRRMHDQEHQFCMLGAIGAADGMYQDDSRSSRDFEASGLRMEAAHLLGKATGVGRYDNYCDVPQLNDAQNTTHADVMAAFDIAIEQAEKDGL